MLHNDCKDFLSEATWPSNWHYDISVTPNDGGLLQLPAMCPDGGRKLCAAVTDTKKSCWFSINIMLLVTSVSIKAITFKNYVCVCAFVFNLVC